MKISGIAYDLQYRKKQKAMSSVLNSPVLVLNKSWNAIHIKTAKDAICDVFTECAKIIDTYDEFSQLYTWKEWELLEPIPGQKVIKMPHTEVRVPKIIVLTEYNEIPQIEINLTRKNLLLRDNYSCQYCGKRVNNETFTVDHVFPRAKGGKYSWENCVIACFHCNSKKRDRTLKESGFVLRSKPHKPRWYPLASHLSKNIDECWKQFLPEGKIPLLT